LHKEQAPHVKLHIQNCKLKTSDCKLSAFKLSDFKLSEL
jgi:hypothetical protein